MAYTAGPGPVGYSGGHLPRVVQRQREQYGNGAPTAAAPAAPLAAQGGGGRLPAAEVHEQEQGM